MSDEKSVQSNKSKTEGSKFAPEKSLHLRDLFGSQWSFDDDPSEVVEARQKEKEEEDAAHNNAPTEEEGDQKPPAKELLIPPSQIETPAEETPAEEVPQQGDSPQKPPPESHSTAATITPQPVLHQQESQAQSATQSHAPSSSAAATTPLHEGLPEPITITSEDPDQTGNQYPTTPIQNKKYDYDATLHLRDVFGSQWTFDDDPTVVVQARQKQREAQNDPVTEEENEQKPTAKEIQIPTQIETTTEEIPQQDNNPEKFPSQQSHSTAASFSPQPVLRQRKSPAPSMDRIRRPTRKGNNYPTNDSNISGMGTVATAASTITSPTLLPSVHEKKTLGPLGEDESITGYGMDSFASGSFRNEQEANSPTMHDLDDGEDTEVSEVNEGQVFQSQLDEEAGGAWTDDRSQNADPMLNDKSHNSDTFQDEYIESQHGAYRVPTYSAALVKDAESGTFETPRQTCCVSCTICTVFMTVFCLFQALSLILLNQDPSLVHPAQTMTTTPPNSVPPIEGILGPNLPETTVNAIHHEWDSPQSTAFRWLHADPNHAMYPLHKRQQRYVLAALYFATNPPYEHNWKQPGFWLSYDVSECYWLLPATPNMTTAELQDHPLNLCRTTSSKNKEDEQKVPGQRRLRQLAQEDMVVRSLPLQDQNLEGPIPPDLELLSSLSSVHLDQNKLTGEIPSEWLKNKQPKLTTVQLQGNPKLTGELPAEWCAIPSLKFDCKSSGKGGVCGCNCPC